MYLSTAIKSEKKTLKSFILLCEGSRRIWIACVCWSWNMVFGSRAAGKRRAGGGGEVSKNASRRGTGSASAALRRPSVKVTALTAECWTYSHSRLIKQWTMHPCTHRCWSDHQIWSASFNTPLPSYGSTACNQRPYGLWCNVAIGYNGQAVCLCSFR